MNDSELNKQFEELKTSLKRYKDKADTKKLHSAWKFMNLAHHGQKRMTGHLYASHALATAKYLSEWKLDVTSILAGLLHDTIEDGGAKREDIVKSFGEEVAKLVDGVTKVSDIKLRGKKDEEFVENLRKMFLAMAKDLRVVLIKLADRLHNMQTLYALPQEKQERIAKETLEVFAPIAERLGMGEVKARLEDLAFPYVYPEKYRKIKKESREYLKTASTDLKKMKRAILVKFAKEKLRARVDTRQKHYYSLWRKLERPDISWDFKKVHDIIALRVITQSVSDCYSTLGVVHSLYKPVPHLGVSDFIAQPKPNGYQSIHTKVFGPGSRAVEVQIRTLDMHRQAEYGIAAHWYLGTLKSKGKITSEDVEKGILAKVPKKLEWVRQLADWQSEMTDSGEFLNAVKLDVLTHRNFVFSPKGDVYDLPIGATVIDYAYAVHTELGNFIKAAKVNGKIVPLDYKLKSGDVCEIIKRKSPGKPNSDWLDFVVTESARRGISKFLRRR